MPTYPNIALIDVDGDLDVTSYEPLRAQMNDLIDHRCRRIILDVTHVDFLDSAGMFAILSAARRMRRAGGLISLTNASPAVYRSLQVACLLDYVPTTMASRQRVVPQLAPTSRPLSHTTLLVDPSHMDSTRARLRTIMRRMSLSADDSFDMVLACGEAIGNAVDHACPDGVTVTVEGYDDRVVAQVLDCGCGYELGEGEEPVSECGTEERGRGIKLMRLLADAVSIERRQDASGTSVTLVKMLESAVPVAARTSRREAEPSA